MPDNTLEKIEQLEKVLYQSLCYAKLVNTPYFDSIDQDKYALFQKDLISVESYWKDISAGTAAGAAAVGVSEATNGQPKHDYGRHGNYAGSKAPGASQNFKQWAKMEVGEMTTNGIVSFVKTLERLSNILSGWLRNIKVKWKLRKINHDNVVTQLNMITEYINRRKELSEQGKKTLTVYAPDIFKLCSRLDGYKRICGVIHNLAANADANAFDSDKTWDEFARESHGAIVARPPKKGLYFRELERTDVYVSHFNCVESEWNNRDSLQKLGERVLNNKDRLFVKIKDDMVFLKKITDGLLSDVSHRKFTNGDMGGDIADDNIKTRTWTANTVFRGSEAEAEEVVVRYARSYVASKFLLQLQDMFIEEVNYDLFKVPKMFAIRLGTQKDKELQDKA